MHVLLALDGSKESMEAARFLTRLPVTGKPKVTLVRALQGMTFDDAGVLLQEVEKEKEIASEGLRATQELLESAGYTTEQALESGHPSRIIVSKGEELDVDLIVLGARGHSAAYRVILGSTANFVANHARCPVLVVRPRPTPPTAEERLRIMLAFDGSPPAKIAHDQLFSFAWPQDSTHITLATFFEKPHLLSDEEVYDQEAINKAGKVLDEMRENTSCKCVIQQVVRETKHIGDALRDLTEDEHAELLFIGDTGKSAITRFFLGSISRYLLHHTKASIWIARKKEWK